MASNIAARSACRSLSTNGKAAVRTLSTNAKSGYTWDEPIPSNYTIDSIKPANHWSKPDDVVDPMSYNRKPVSSAHAIDLAANPPKLSAKDSAAFSPSGTVIHGRYGELSIDSSAGIPLEYLALLQPAAEGVAALRTIADGATNGTLLVYGASEPSAMASLQLASHDGLAVVGVVAGQHSGDPEFVDTVKSMTSEPGTVVPEEVALVKGFFRELVSTTVDGETMDGDFDTNTFVSDFQKNLLDYAEYYPETSLAPATQDYEFVGKEKDRKHWDENISTYLSQFQKGSPPFDEVVLKESFTKEQYAIFKAKFGKQTTAVITGDDDAATEFNPAEIAKAMTDRPEAISEYLKEQKHSLDGASGDFIPYEFSTLKSQIGNGMDVVKGGPILGAVINVTPELTIATEAVAKGKTLREKAEALQFLTESEKNAFAAANSVAKIAKDAGTAVVVVGGELPGFESIVPTDDDVKEALSAMSLSEDGSSRLNYYLQVYRASDYPVYADYAIHRAQEDLSGPRQIVVTK